MDKVKTILTKCLLAFALLSVGYALGKHAAQRSAPQPAAAPDQDGKVAVYYFHSTFRCATCNDIEKKTKALLDKNYGKEMTENKIVWKQDDFQENQELARRFGIVASCVVVAKIKDGAIVDFQRLDKVWELTSDAAAFDKYVAAAIDAYLRPQGGKS